MKFIFINMLYIYIILKYKYIDIIDKSHPNFFIYTYPYHIAPASGHEYTKYLFYDAI